MHTGALELCNSFRLVEELMEEQDMLEELAEEEFVKEDSNADLALYLACGGLFVLVAVFIVSACIFIRYTIRQVKLCLFEKKFFPF